MESRKTARAEKPQGKVQRVWDDRGAVYELGEKLAEDPETFRWTDASGAAVTVELVKGRCVRWSLARPDDAGGAPVGGEDRP